MIGPTYQARYLPGYANHIGSLGRMMLGDVAGLVLSQLIQRKDFVPLRSTAGILRNKTVMMKFAVPGGPLAFDHQTMPPVPNDGFVFSDSSRSARIASGRLVARDAVELELTNLPTGANPTISCASDTERNMDGYGSGRGTLFSDDNAQSLFAGLGFHVPAKIRHHAVRFQ